MDKADERQIIAVALDAINMMQKAAHAPSDRPQDALQVISVIIDVLRDGLLGKTTPEVVAAELKALTTHDKFDTGDED